MDFHPVCQVCTDTESADLGVLAAVRQTHECACGAIFYIGEEGPEIVGSPDLTSWPNG